MKRLQVSFMTDCVTGLGPENEEQPLLMHQEEIQLSNLPLLRVASNILRYTISF